MIISQVNRTPMSGEGRQELTAVVTYESHGPRRFRVYFSVEGAPHEILGTADPFVIGSVVSAMLLGEDLRIEGPVDSELITTIRDNIMPLLRRWLPFLHEIELDAREQSAPPSPASGGGALPFSAGLDACYTGVKQINRIDWLVVSKGFDIRTYHDHLWMNAQRPIENAARFLSRPLIRIATNIREVSHFHALQLRGGWVDPGYYDFALNGPIGPYLASITRCLAPFCSRAFISASIPYDAIYPFSTHPLFDPMWSTSMQRIVHDGAEADRGGKIGYLKKHCPEMLKHLRVCWTPGIGEVNCSQCEKCLRTMAHLRIEGAEAYGKSFRWPLEVHRIRKLQLDELHRLFWRQVDDAAIRAGDRELHDAIRKVTRTPLRIRFPPSRSRAEKQRRKLTRRFWKETRRKMKPPEGHSPEIRTVAQRDLPRHAIGEERP